MFNMISLFNAVSSVEIPEVPDGIPEASDQPYSLIRTEVVDNSQLDPANKAIVTNTIEPGKAGQVRFQGSWWNARCEQNLTLTLGQTVYVISDPGSMPLIVEPAPVDERFGRSGLQNVA